MKEALAARSGMAARKVAGVAPILKADAAGLSKLLHPCRRHSASALPRRLPFAAPAGFHGDSYVLVFRPKKGFIRVDQGIRRIRIASPHISPPDGYHLLWLDSLILFPHADPQRPRLSSIRQSDQIIHQHLLVLRLPSPGKFRPMPTELPDFAHFPELALVHAIQKEVADDKDNHGAKADSHEVREHAPGVALLSVPGTG
mmetsp:Transcript_10747/g.26626  ORF Transcript_10747/g.26626 Transcript_10747/m.26626 type:complete len:200 (+) Transcript_10747:600-1199(+)